MATKLNLAILFVLSKVMLILQLLAERVALNFLQTLSGVTTKTAYHVEILQDTEAKLLDTCKTIPGLRSTLKYVVIYGGAFNHRLGLFDAHLIKKTISLQQGILLQKLRKRV